MVLVCLRLCCDAWRLPNCCFPASAIHRKAARRRPFASYVCTWIHTTYVCIHRLSTYIWMFRFFKQNPVTVSIRLDCYVPVVVEGRKNDCATFLVSTVRAGTELEGIIFPGSALRCTTRVVVSSGSGGRPSGHKDSLITKYICWHGRKGVTRTIRGKRH